MSRTNKLQCVRYSKAGGRLSGCYCIGGFLDTEWADGAFRRAQQTGHGLPQVRYGTSLTSASLSRLQTIELHKLHAKAAKR